MNIQQNVSLKKYNTFGIEALAKYFVDIHSAKDLKDLLRSDIYHTQEKFLILGGGSNILLTNDFDGLVIKMSISGIDRLQEDEEHVWLKIGAGEVWHDLVLHTIDYGLGGIENLSLIPGTVGAAPMQNIGAYGVEIKEVFEELEAVNVETAEMEKFTNEECAFGYRDSIFKQHAKGKYIITHVTLRLTKKHELNLEYGAISSILNEKGIENPTIRDVSSAVIGIRQSKLPDPVVIGNAGSFFKNPVVSKEEFDELIKNHSNIPHYPQEDGIKIPAGWLIEQCGWKGKRRGDIGVHKNQALVLVNYGGGSGADLKKLSQDIRESVMEKFGISLETEVNFI